MAYDMGSYYVKCISNPQECPTVSATLLFNSAEDAFTTWNTRSAESKVLEDIKAEIKERIEMWGTDNDEYHDCLEIIDKHIGEANNGL